MKPETKILLILNRGSSHDYKILVQLHTRDLVNRVNDLVEKNKQREAFDLVVSEGEVEDYIPAGRKLNVKPKIIFVEDLL